ncbi:MAG: helix-turn-helix transcriptional regulator [Pyrinomonadaceae bacterium]
MKRPRPQPHWTEANLDDYKSRITFDFLAQMLDFMAALPISQADLAGKLGIGESAVSQILNNPNNLTLKTIIKYTRALGLKVSLLAYDDDDPDNTRGPVGSEIFAECWKRLGKPREVFVLASAQTTDDIPSNVIPMTNATTTAATLVRFPVMRKAMLPEWDKAA